LPHLPLRRVATFNIENFPKHTCQEAGAFATLASLGVSAIAVQEIVDTQTFASAAATRLGDIWRVTFATTSSQQRVAVLYDSVRLSLRSTHSWHEVATYSGAKPMFEARFIELQRGEALELLGDFNATGEGDRRNIAALAAATRAR
jgi:hypothetical protein